MLTSHLLMCGDDHSDEYNTVKTNASTLFSGLWEISFPLAVMNLMAGRERSAVGPLMSSD